MKLDFSAFQNKPIKSTANPLDFSAFQKAPIKTTATPLDLSETRVEPIKTTATPLDLSAFQSKAKEQMTSTKADVSGGIKKLIAGKGVISLFKKEPAPITYQEALQQGFNKFREQFSLADANTPEGREKITHLAINFMPIGDIVSIGNKIPKGKVIDIVGDTTDLVVQGIKNIFNTISKTNNTQIIVKALQQGIGGETKALTEIATKLKDITDPVDVAQIIKNNSTLDIKLPIKTTALETKPVGFGKEVEGEYVRGFSIGKNIDAQVNKIGKDLVIFNRKNNEIIKKFPDFVSEWNEVGNERLLNAYTQGIQIDAGYFGKLTEPVLEKKKLYRVVVNGNIYFKTGFKNEAEAFLDGVKDKINKVFEVTQPKPTPSQESIIKQATQAREQRLTQEGFVKPTTQPTDLIQEAKKAIAEGKSADEFVKAQGEPVYHGTSEIISGDFRFPLYLTENKAYADIYQHTGASSLGRVIKKGGGEKTFDFMKAPKERILDVRNPEHLDILERYFQEESVSGGFYPSKRGLTDWTEGEGIAQFIEDNKLPFDAILIDEGGIPDVFTGKTIDRGIGYVALNKNAIKTKSQLKEIYNKAKGVTSKEIPKKIITTKVQPKITKELVVQEPQFLHRDTLTNNVIQEQQTVKQIKEGLDPNEVKSFETIIAEVPKKIIKEQIEFKSLTPDTLEFLEHKQIEIEFLKEKLNEHPAKSLMKYVSRKLGTLPEATGVGKLVFAKKGDTFMSELGYESTQEAREDLHKYVELKDELKQRKEDIKPILLQEKDDAAIIKLLNKRQIKVGTTKVILEDRLTTRKIKQSDHFQNFAKYAEKHIIRDIHAPWLKRHITMTAERVAEYLDEGIGGRVYREMVRPVYKSTVAMTQELHQIKNEIDKFKIIEGSVNDRDASLFAQKKLQTASKQAQDIANYSRAKYDEWLVRMNETRASIGVEPIPKRKDYITHINEINVLTELLGGVDRITIKDRISRLKNEFLDKDANLSSVVAFERAKRQVEGTTGLEMYIDARQPIFKYAKRRLGEYEKNPSVLRSVRAYSRSAMRYIHQAKNVAKNKAYKDVLPANAKEFMRLWNTEQVAGRTPSSVMNPITKRIIHSLRGTIGANTILGNMATTMMQLTSFPQVFALAGSRNATYGIITRLASYVSKSTGKYSLSRTKTTRNLDIDIGMGQSLVDSLLMKIGEVEKLRNTTAYARASIDFGRTMLMGIMETADQFTVGASFEAFYRKGILDGFSPERAIEYADIMTGKTQANYFKEALPPFLNTIEGKVLGQFGTYSFNQWEMFRKDFGKALKLDKKTPRETKLLFQHFIFALIGAYLVDMLSEDIFGRQPYEVKDLIDEGIAMTQGKTDVEHLLKQGAETVLSYVPFMSSVKFNSLPPVLDFGSDLLQFAFGNDAQKVAKAKRDLQEKWALSVLLPYGGNQVRKTLQGIETISDVDIPFIKKVDLGVESNIEKIKAVLFGAWATEAGQDYFETKKQAEIIKNKIEKAVKNEDYSKLSETEKISSDIRNAIRDKYSFLGAITDEINLTKIQNLPQETQDIFINTYAETTQKTIRRNLLHPPVPKTLEHQKRLFKEKLKKALENGTITTEEAIEKIKQFKSIIEKVE